jgi:hypothetical protein
VSTLAAALSADGATLAVTTAQAPDDIEVWDLRQHVLIGRTPRQASPVVAIAWATNADVYASADDNQVVVWSGTDARATLDVPAGGLVEVALSSDGHRVCGARLRGRQPRHDPRRVGAPSARSQTSVGLPTTLPVSRTAPLLALAAAAPATLFLPPLLGATAATVILAAVAIADAAHARRRPPELPSSPPGR